MEQQKNEIRQGEENYLLYLREYQFRRRLSPSFFIFSKEGAIWLLVVYLLYGNISALFWIIFILLSFTYMIKYMYNYMFYEKEKLFAFDKIKRIFFDESENNDEKDD